MELEAVKEIAKAHGKTPAQVVIRHALQRGLVVTPKASHPERIIENIQVGKTSV